MPAAVPFIPAIAGVAGSLIGASASKKASKQQARSQQQAIDTQNELIGPYSDAGVAGLGGVQDFVDNGARFSDTQAFKDITNSAKAGGMSLSGNRLTALSDYYATNFRPQRLNELMQLPTLGANAAARQATNVGGLQQNIGTARAQGTTAIGQNFADIAGTLGSLNFSSLTQPNNLSNTTGGGVPGLYGGYSPPVFNPNSMPGRTGG